MSELAAGLAKVLMIFMTAQYYDLCFSNLQIACHYTIKKVDITAPSNVAPTKKCINWQTGGGDR